MRLQSISPICQGFDLVLDLHEMYFSIVPKNLGGTAEETEHGMEDGDKCPRNHHLAKQKFWQYPSSLGETIQLLFRERVSGENEGKGKATEKVTSIVDEIIRALFFGNDNDESHEEVAKMFHALFLKTLDHMNHSDHGSTSHAQKFIHCRASKWKKEEGKMVITLLSIVCMCSQRLLHPCCFHQNIQQVIHVCKGRANLESRD